MHLARQGFALGLLALFLPACAGDSLPTHPDAPSSAAPVDAVLANYLPDSWANKTSMPTARRGLVTATVNGIIYAIGGRSTNEVNLRTVEAYNPVATLIAWTPKAPMPSPRAWPSGAATINGKIYVPGGLNADANPTKTLFVYNPGTNTWVKKAAMPVASYGGAAVVINGKLYVVTPSGSSTLLHRYDPATNTWTARAPGLHGHYYPVAGVINGKLYVAGTMHSDDSPSSLVSMYDPASNTWTAKTGMPGDQIGAGGRVLGGKLYAIGGFVELNSVPRAATYAYDPVTNSWAEKTLMPSSRGFLSAAAANGVLYAIGGLSTPNVLATNQAYTP
jgi:kelch-like protein 17 (actinfilin)/kelch-like protein 20